MDKKIKPSTLTDKRILVIASRALQLSSDCGDNNAELDKSFFELDDEEYDFLINYTELYPENEIQGECENEKYE